ncbi:MAG: hypothetical protein OES79_06265 [Planctomycetota bacterium]|nr:hypothetical protein [Planctomycetota bacterium]
MIHWLTGRMLAGCLGAGIVCALAGCGQPATAPTVFTVCNSLKGTFQNEFPDGWEISQGGKTGMAPEWCKATLGSAEIKVSADLTGSLLGDISQAGQNMLGEFAPEGPEDEPVAELHEMGREAIEKVLNSYQEVGGTEVISCQLGPARKSEFTAAGAFGGALHGYRVTVLGRDKRVVMICRCAESDWATLQPAFDRVLASLQPDKR